MTTLPERTFERAPAVGNAPYRIAARAPATWRAIRGQWQRFEAWCRNEGLRPLPADADTIEAYLVLLARQGYAVATIDQARYAIDARHQLAGLPSMVKAPGVQETVAGIRRSHGVAQRAKAPLTMDDLRRVSFPDHLRGVRDRALLLVGFAAGLRRVELAHLRAEHLTFDSGDLVLWIPRSKGDQEGRGETVTVVPGVNPTTCPVRALRAWLSAAGIAAGPVWRSVTPGGSLRRGTMQPEAIGGVVKWAAVQLGRQSDLYGGHSLRAGCATYLLAHGVPVHVVAKHLRHRRLDTTLRYDRGQTARAMRGIY